MPVTLIDIQKKYGVSVYPLYKDQIREPYMENDIGEGYKGIVLYDKNEDKVQCSECGNWFRKITAGHLKNHGFKTVNDYKDKYGILYKAALQGLEISRIQSERASENKNFLSHMGQRNSEWLRKAQTVLRQRISSRKAHRKAAYKNMKGLCDAQIKERLKVVASIVKRDVRDNDLRRYDTQVGKALEYRFGNVNKGIKYYGYIPPSQKGEWRITDAQLIGELRLFVFNNNLVPSAKDLTKFGLHDWKTYQKRFGSWRRAKMMAGTDQI